MYTSPPSLSITCIAMGNVRKILKDRHLSVNGLLTLIHSKHPDCGMSYNSLRRLVSHERKMTIDEAILICDALNVPFTSLLSFAGEFPHGQLKGMTAVDITTPLNRMIGPKKGQIITRYWGYTRIVRQTISPAWHERTLVCCLKTYIMYQPMREPRRLAPTLGILALVCRLRTDLPRQTTL